MIIISKSIVSKLGESRPGFLDDVLSRGSLSKSGHHVLEPEDWESLLDQFGARAEFDGEAEPLPAGAVMKALASGITAWVKAGLPVAPKEIYQERWAICEGCEHWNPRGWLGLGKCRICKCSRIKFALATEQCPLPIPKWISYEAPRKNASNPEVAKMGDKEDVSL